MPDLGPIGRLALTWMLPGEVFASRGKQETKALLDPFASRIRLAQYAPYALKIGLRDRSPC